MLHAYMIHTWQTKHVHKLHQSRQGPNAMILKASSQENSWTFNVNCNVFLRVTFGETCDSPIKWANAKFIKKGLEDVHYMWGFQKKNRTFACTSCLVALCVTWFFSEKHGNFKVWGNRRHAPATNSQPIRLIRGDRWQKGADPCWYQHWHPVGQPGSWEVGIQQKCGETFQAGPLKIQDTAIEKGRFSRSLPKPFPKPTAVFLKSCRW